MVTETIVVPEVHCHHCVHSIEGALQPMAGVSSARVDLEARAVEVTYDETQVARDALVAAIEEQGYAVPDGTDTSEPPRGQLPLA